MNAEQFYEGFKDALKFLGLRWGDMHLATVSVDTQGSVVVSYGGRHATVDLPAAEA